MQSVKKAVKSVVDKEQKRILVVSLVHDGELVVKGDNISYSLLADDEATKTALKRMLNEDPEESETSYNFGQQLSYVESQNLEFQKMFAKIGGKNWKDADVAKTLSQYMSILDFGLNSPKTYGKKEDKPVWWPKKPKWKNFRNPSKVSKDECTAIIKLLLEHYGIYPEIHYVNFPDEESEESSDSSSEEEDAGNRDDEEEEDDGDEEEDSSEEEENGNKRARNISLAKTAEEVSTACTYILRKELKG